MGSEEQETKTIDEMAAKMAQDITALNKKAAEVKLPSDLREIDLAPLVPPGTTGLLKSAFTRLSTESAKVRQEHEAQVQEQSQALEESINARQQAMKQKMTELEKTEAEAGDTARVVRLRMNKEVKRYEQRVVELQQDKIVRSGRVDIRPGAAKVDVTPATPEAPAAPATPVKKAAKKASRKSPNP